MWVSEIFLVCEHMEMLRRYCVWRGHENSYLFLHTLPYTTLHLAIFELDLFMINCKLVKKKKVEIQMSIN